jgi:hypothetical protein
MCASVSRTDPKLDPSGFVNCSLVKFAAAPKDRWFAHAL